MIEDELGAKLLNRTARRVSLTVAGEVLLEEARRILGAVNRAHERMQEVVRGTIGRIRIGATPTPGLYVLPRLLARYREEHDTYDVRFEIAPVHEIAERVARNDLDMAVIAGPPPTSELQARALTRDDLVVITSPTTSLARARAIKPGQLESETWLVREEGSDTRRQVMGWWHRHRIAPGRTMTFSGPDALKGATMAGLGVAMLSRLSVADEFDERSSGHRSRKGCPAQPRLLRCRSSPEASRRRVPRDAAIVRAGVRGSVAVVAPAQAARPLIRRANRGNLFVSLDDSTIGPVRCAGVSIRRSRGSAPRPAGECRAVRAPCGHQRIRGCDGGHGAHHPAGDREQEFRLAARTAVLSFIVVFGLTKAFTNYLAGHLADRTGRKQVLVAGWLIAVPVPFMLMWAPSWPWILVANALLGVSQGLTWSTTVIMKIDLVGPGRRGLAMGLNEFAGYVALAAAALATGWIAATHGLRPEPFYPGVGFVALGLVLSIVLVRDTTGHVALESNLRGAPGPTLDARDVFWRTTLTDQNLSTISQAGLVNNLNDGMAWGLFPLFFAAAGMGLQNIAILAAVYPATWGVLQLATGALSDRFGRKWFIAGGMCVQAAGIAVVIVSSTFVGFVTGAVLLGVGTAMVYPTLLAAIGDVANPSWRASAVGVYRLWRDLGYAIGALLAGLTADLVGVPGAMWLVAGVTLTSGVIAACRMTETLGRL